MSYRTIPQESLRKQWSKQRKRELRSPRAAASLSGSIPGSRGLTYVCPVNGTGGSRHEPTCARHTSTTSTFGAALTPAAGEPAAWITEDVVPAAHWRAQWAARDITQQRSPRVRTRCDRDDPRGRVALGQCRGYAGRAVRISRGFRARPVRYPPPSEDRGLLSTSPAARPAASGTMPTCRAPFQPGAANAGPC